MKIRHSLLLVLTALIWGIAFVAQSTGGDLVGPLAFNCIRSLIGGLVLLPAIVILDKLHLTKRQPTNNSERKLLLLGGTLCGICLCVASNVQQLGIYMGTSAGKAGFLTACYILLVPIISLFLKKKCGWNIWVGVVIAVIGLYLLCMTDSISLQFSDLLVLICALVFAIHILVIDRFSPLVDGVRMSCIQFFVCGLLTIIPAFVFEMHCSIMNLFMWTRVFWMSETWISLLYAGVMSCGVAYTLQIVGQEGLNPTIASLIMSLESVFSVIAGWIILHEYLTPRQLVGCLLIFSAIVLAQIPVKKLIKVPIQK